MLGLNDAKLVFAPPIYQVITIRPYVDNGYVKHDPGNLAIRAPKAWALYRAIMQEPPAERHGNVFVVTKAEKLKWWLRKQLVNWGVI